MEELVVREGSANWVHAVWDRAKDRCEHCGGIDRLKARLIVPEDAGGKKVPSNATIICRTCELAEELSRRSQGPFSGKGTRPINFWVSRKLYSRVQNGLSEKYGFNSVASLVRYLMAKFVEDPSRFDDVSHYQESGADVKVNVWVPQDSYLEFKTLADREGLTVTDTLKGLIRMYEMEIDRVVGARLEAQ